MKLIKYLILLIPYLVSSFIICFLYEKMSVITYLVFMIAPMVVSSLLVGIAKYKNIFVVKDSILALVCTAIYLLFFIAMVLLLSHYNAIEFICKNSQYLFREGFSIGDEFSANLSDAILPCGLCFCMHILGIYIIKSIQKGVKKCTSFTGKEN